MIFEGIDQKNSPCILRPLTISGALITEIITTKSPHISFDPPVAERQLAISKDIMFSKVPKARGDYR